MYEGTNRFGFSITGLPVPPFDPLALPLLKLPTWLSTVYATY